MTCGCVSKTTAVYVSSYIVHIERVFTFDCHKLRAPPCSCALLSSYPKEGAYCEGLFLDGARWNLDEGCLEEPPPMELFYQMPVIHFKVLILNADLPLLLLLVLVGRGSSSILPSMLLLFLFGRQIFKIPQVVSVLPLMSTCPVR